MKILIITNLAPMIDNLISGIFITNRLKEYEKFKVSYIAVSLGFDDTTIVKLIKKALKKPSSKAACCYQGVFFEPINIRRGLIGVVKSRSNYHILVDEFVKSIENEFDISSFDIIHAHGMFNVPAGEVAKELANRYHKPYIVTLHGDDVNTLMSVPKRKEKYLRVLNQADKVIFVSQALLKKASALGFNPKNAVVIPNGYNPQIFKPMDKNTIRRDLRIYQPNTRYVGFVGALAHVKRADKLVEIFSSIKKELPDVKFIVVGDGEYRAMMEKQAQKLDLDLMITGFVQQELVAKYMNAMDVMILPSRNEGFGAVCIEAQACGTCVIGSNNGGIPEAIGFEEYIVEEGQDFEKRFAQRVVDILKNGYDSQKLIERVKNYMWIEIVRKEIQVYEEVLLGRSKQ
ncbi:MAG: glycosyltransferase [candidate division WOR-3 bacterium]